MKGCRFDLFESKFTAGPSPQGLHQREEELTAW